MPLSRWVQRTSGENWALVGRQQSALGQPKLGLRSASVARRDRPLAITLDIQMDGLDGWKTLAMLKNDAELCDIPVILITIVDEKSLGRELGAFDYLS